jgi:hypothetical protein
MIPTSTITPTNSTVSPLPDRKDVPAIGVSKLRGVLRLDAQDTGSFSIALQHRAGAAAKRQIKVVNDSLMVAAYANARVHVDSETGS